MGGLNPGIHQDGFISGKQHVSYAILDLGMSLITETGASKLHLPDG